MLSNGGGGMGRWLASAVLVMSLVVGLSGCDSGPEPVTSNVPELIGQVQEGASQADVEKLLGPADHKYTDEEDDGEVWQWNADDGVYRVKFVDGQVASQEKGGA